MGKRNQAYSSTKYWTGICYPENMRPDWQQRISDLIQVPYCYCVHDKGLEMEEDEAERKVHVHVIIVFGNTTTQNHAFEVLNSLSAPGKKCLPFVQPVYGMDHLYHYLIHDTKDAKKKGKYQFDKSERIEGNNFDIGAYVQVSKEDKDRAFDNLTALILASRITNFADFVSRSLEEFEDEHDLYRDVIRGWSGYFDRLIKGQYHRTTESKGNEKAREMKEKLRKSGSVLAHEDSGQGDGDAEYEGFNAECPPLGGWADKDLM